MSVINLEAILYVILKTRPGNELDFECLEGPTLPFAEDVRSDRFAPSEKVFTITGKVFLIILACIPTISSTRR